MTEPRGRAVSGNVTSLAPEPRRMHLRMLEAMLFAATEPVSEAQLSARMPEEADVSALLLELQAAYAGRGVNLRPAAGGWVFRTAEDLAFLFRHESAEQKKLSRAALETLAIIAYHQPCTRAEIEEIRGVAISRGTLDVLMEAGWVGLGRRRQTPGRPVTFGTTAAFLDHFGLDAISDLPGVGELKAAGLLDPTPVKTGQPDALDTDDDDRDELGESSVSSGSATNGSTHDPSA
jgi:segregation and condensation protein B